MRIINADGSEAEMCGNGIRCLVKYLYDCKHPKKKKLMIETLAGKIQTESFFKNGKFHKVKVNMGDPTLERRKIPMLGKGKDTDESVEINNEKISGTGVSIGNPHFVIFDKKIRDMDKIKEIGAAIESHKLFPNRTNVEFVQVISDKEVRAVVYERGCGITLACGTGACAVVVVGVVKGKLKADVPIIVHLLGGDLEIIVSRNLKRVEMIGSAEKVFEGEIHEKF
jgi:diaminopimelate epimerase